MAMVTSGPVSLGGDATSGGLNRSVNIELNRAATATINMNESAVRTLFLVPSGAISMNDAYGKSNEYNVTISSNQINANLRTIAINAGWNGINTLIVTINAGVYVYSNSTATPALTISGSFPNGLNLINNGYVVGMGGAGNQGAAATGSGGGNGFSGGTALSVSSAVTINNASGVIAGGGGGGGGGGSFQENDFGWAGGGGGGGQSSFVDSAAGSAGGGTFNQRSRDPAPGTVGTLSAAGSGGIGAAAPNAQYYAGYGGNGGSWGSAGSTGQAANGVPGGPTQSPGTGGAGGAAVSGNSNVTWTNTGTRYGGIS